jgi:hypothetical protein
MLHAYKYTLVFDAQKFIYFSLDIFAHQNNKKV